MLSVIWNKLSDGCWGQTECKLGKFLWGWRWRWGNHPLLLLLLLLAAYVESLPLSRYSSPSHTHEYKLSPQPWHTLRGGLCFGVVAVHTTCCPPPQTSTTTPEQTRGRGGEEGVGCIGCGKWDIDGLISIIDVRVARELFGLHSTSSLYFLLLQCCLSCLWASLAFCRPSDWLDE